MVTTLHLVLPVPCYVREANGDRSCDDCSCDLSAAVMVEQSSIFLVWPAFNFLSAPSAHRLPVSSKNGGLSERDSRLEMLCENVLSAEANHRCSQLPVTCLETKRQSDCIWKCLDTHREHSVHRVDFQFCSRKKKRVKE